MGVKSVQRNFCEFRSLFIEITTCIQLYPISLLVISKRIVSNKHVASNLFHFPFAVTSLSLFSVRFRVDTPYFIKYNSRYRQMKIAVLHSLMSENVNNYNSPRSCPKTLTAGSLSWLGGKINS